MGLRVRKSIKLGKNAKINLGKKGASVTVGTKGLHHTIHSSGRKTTTASIPGTGISYSKTSSGGKKNSTGTTDRAQTTITEPSEKKKSGCGGCLISIISIIVIILSLSIIFGTDKDDKSIEKETTEAKVFVDSIALNGYKEELVVGETTHAEATISPDNADDKTLIWESSDETVALVDEKGEVKAVGGGKAYITATISYNSKDSQNEVSASYGISVDGKKSMMDISVRHSRENDVNIGDEWSYDIQLNGERVPNDIILEEGDELEFYAKFTEEDDNPDVGSESTTHTVTKDDLKNGFDVSMNLYVTENGGRYSGESAHFVVTFEFTPTK